MRKILRCTIPVLLWCFGWAVQPNEIIGSRKGEMGYFPSEIQTVSFENGVIARIYFPDRETMQRYASFLDVIEINNEGKYFLALVSSMQYQEMRSKGVPIEMDAGKTARMTRLSRKDLWEAADYQSLSCYRTVEEIETTLTSLTTQFPNLVSTVDIGDSWEKIAPEGAAGYDLKVAVLTNKAGRHPKFKFFLMGAVHAREMVTAETALLFMEHLVNAYGKDADVTWLLDYGEMHVLPMANPDGRKWAEKGYYQRKNTNSTLSSLCMTPDMYYQFGVDLNRNNDSHWGEIGASTVPCDATYQGASADSEPETQAIQTYLKTIFPDQRGPKDTDAAPKTATGLFLSLHSYGNLVLFPWGYTGEKNAPNYLELQTLARKFSYYNQYKAQRSAELYPCSGTNDDWMYDKLGVASYVFEMGREFFENCTSFQQDIWVKALPTLIYAAKASRLPYQSPAGPEVTEIRLDRTRVMTGMKVLLTGIADDTRFAGESEPTQKIADIRYSVDVPSWISGARTVQIPAVAGGFLSSREEVRCRIDTTGWSIGRHQIFVEAKDADGNWGVPTSLFLEVERTGSIWLPEVRKSAH